MTAEISYVGAFSSAYNVVSQGTLTLQAGDLLLAFVANPDQATVTAPTQFTPTNPQGNCLSYYHYYVSGDPTSYTFTSSATSTDLAAILVVYRSVNQLDTIVSNTPRVQNIAYATTDYAQTNQVAQPAYEALYYTNNPPTDYTTGSMALGEVQSFTFSATGLYDGATNEYEYFMVYETDTYYETVTGMTYESIYSFYSPQAPLGGGGWGVVAFCGDMAIDTSILNLTYRQSTASGLSSSYIVQVSDTGILNSSSIPSFGVSLNSAQPWSGSTVVSLAPGSVVGGLCAVM